MLTSSQLRDSFIQFFEKKDHTMVPSSSVVPYNDKSLLFVNSGMVQFKSVLLDHISQGHPFWDLKRACNSQRCIRAGGKHNDLDDVGKDNYHHTYFEMLGNWSFGDYYKKEAIDMAWEYLTSVLKLNPENLYVTYYDGIFVDEEAKEHWKKYLPENRILPFEKENFWEMADVGPCGSCTEIHYDRIGGRFVPELVNKDDPNLLEIWNLVFMEYFRDSTGKLIELKKKNVDTGMGFERILSVVNGVKSNYQTDLFIPIFDFIYGERKKGFLEESTLKHMVEMESPKEYTDTESSIDIAYRIVADHSRTIVVCLNDSVFPENTGRGYVVRRIIRRAIKYCRETLYVPSLSEIVEFTARHMNIELSEEKIKILKDEEALFNKTLKKGRIYFDKAVDALISKKKFPGETAFVLYDTYGFPIDLTEILCEERGLKLDKVEFKLCMEEAKRKSRMLTEEDKVLADLVTKINDKEPTQETYKYIEEPIVSTLIFEHDSKYLITKETNFYAEKGGQIGDTGTISFYSCECLETKKECSCTGKKIGVFNVNDVQYIDGSTIAHIGTMDGEFSKRCILEVDYERRKKIKANHSGTHILAGLLRDHGKGKQEGSYVSDSKLKLDYSSVREVDVLKIEKNANEIIQSKIKVEIYEKKFSECENVVKLDTEKYPDWVRIIKIGNMEELCSGTHVSRTDEIEVLKIMSHKPSSKSIKRIVAYTGKNGILAQKIEDFVRAIIFDQPKEKKPEVEEKFSEFLHSLKKEDVYKVLYDELTADYVSYGTKLMIEEHRKIEEKVKFQQMKDKTKEIIENLSKEEKIVYQYHPIEKKKIQKEMGKFVSLFKEKKGIIYSIIEDNMYFMSKGEEYHELLSKLDNLKLGGNEIKMGNGQVTDPKKIEEIIKKYKC